jgi:hypothetical protein
MSCCSSTAAAASVVVECTIQMLFNRCQRTDIFPTVIDTRSAAEWRLSHVRRSVSLTVTGDDVRAGLTLDDLLQRAERDHRTVLSRRVAASTIFIYQGGKRPREALFLRELLLAENSAYEVFVVAAGVDAFHTAYPFMCDELTVRESHLTELRAYPVEAQPGFLYVGGVREAMNVDFLQDLQVKSVICMTTTRENPFVDEFQYLNYHSLERGAGGGGGGGGGGDDDETGSHSSCDSATMSEDMSILRLESMDFDDAGGDGGDGTGGGSDAFRRFLDRAFDFLSIEQKAGRRVLVHCRYGSSVSCALVMGWLMFVRRCSLKQAFDELVATKPLVDPPYAYWRQLALYEYELTQASTLHQTVDIDALFPDMPPIKIGGGGCSVM